MAGRIRNIRIIASIQIEEVSTWTPAQLLNLKLWVKSDKGLTLDGAKVRQWDDQSGNSNHLSQATEASKPAYATAQLNGYPAIIFDGIDDYLQTGVFTLNQPTTIFAVIKQVTWTDTRRIWDGIPNNTGGLFQNGASPNIVQYAGNFGAGETNFPVGEFKLISCVYNSTNSTLQTNSSAVNTGDSGTNNMGGFTLAELGLPGLGLASNIAVCEVVIMSSSATSEEIAAMKAYVTERYAITM